MAQNQIPKGKLIAVGGNEDKGTDEEHHKSPYKTLNFFELGILKRIVTESRNNLKSHIEVITAASGIPKEIGDNYIRAFQKLGCSNVNVMHIKKREQADKAEHLKRIEKADVVMFTGGDQTRLTEMTEGTQIHKIISKKYRDENFVIAGTSAGAMAMSENMIQGGSSAEALLRGQVSMCKGLGFAKDLIIDSHFVKRGRFGRLIQTVAENPHLLGVGLGEDTGVLITGGTHFEVIGAGLVIIFDGAELKHVNLDIPEGEPISIENMIVHVLAKGDGYNMQTRKVLPKK
jgi:cyanophycinase